MPLLSPSQIHEVLKESKGLKSNSTPLDHLLENSNLTKEEVLENLSSLMRSAESDSTRLRAAETALKLNGLLNNDEKAENFSVTIIINDPIFTDVNPILIPR